MKIFGMQIPGTRVDTPPGMVVNPEWQKVYEEQLKKFKDELAKKRAANKARNPGSGDSTGNEGYEAAVLMGGSVILAGIILAVIAPPFTTGPGVLLAVYGVYVSYTLARDNYKAADTFARKAADDKVRSHFVKAESVVNVEPIVAQNVTPTDVNPKSFTPAANKSNKNPHSMPTDQNLDDGDQNLSNDKNTNKGWFSKR